MVSLNLSLGAMTDIRGILAHFVGMTDDATIKRSGNTITVSIVANVPTRDFDGATINVLAILDMLIRVEYVTRYSLSCVTANADGAIYEITFYLLNR